LPSILHLAEGAQVDSGIAHEQQHCSGPGSHAPARLGMICPTYVLHMYVCILRSNVRRITNTWCPSFKSRSRTDVTTGFTYFEKCSKNKRQFTAGIAHAILPFHCMLACKKIPSTPCLLASCKKRLVGIRIQAALAQDHGPSVYRVSRHVCTRHILMLNDIGSARIPMHPMK